PAAPGSYDPAGYDPAGFDPAASGQAGYEQAAYGAGNYDPTAPQQFPSTQIPQQQYGQPGGYPGGYPGGQPQFQGWTPPVKPGLIPLHPLTVGNILGGTFSVMRRNPRATF